MKAPRLSSLRRSSAASPSKSGGTSARPRAGGSNGVALSRVPIQDRRLTIAGVNAELHSHFSAGEVTASGGLAVFGRHRTTGAPSWSCAPTTPAEQVNGCPELEQRIVAGLDPVDAGNGI